LFPSQAGKSMVCKQGHAGLHPVQLCSRCRQDLQNFTCAYSQAATLMLIAIASGHNQHSISKVMKAWHATLRHTLCQLSCQLLLIMSGNRTNGSPAHPVCRLYLQSDLLYASKDWLHTQLESDCSRPAALASPARMSAASAATRVCAGQTLAASLFQGLAAAHEPGLPCSHHTLMTHLLRR